MFLAFGKMLMVGLAVDTGPSTELVDGERLIDAGHQEVGI